MARPGPKGCTKPSAACEPVTPGARARSLRRVLIRTLQLLMGGLLAALIGLEVVQVMLRYLLAGGIIWGRDVATLLLFTIAWLGAPLIWMQRGHLAVDLFPGALAGAGAARGVGIALNLILLGGAGALIPVTLGAMQAFAFIDLPTLGTAASVKFIPMLAGTVLLMLAALLGLMTPARQ